MSNDSALIARLAGVSTATLTTVLLKKGLRNVWIRKAFPLRTGQTPPQASLSTSPRRRLIAVQRNCSWTLLRAIPP